MAPSYTYRVRRVLIAMAMLMACDPERLPTTTTDDGMGEDSSSGSEESSDEGSSSSDDGASSSSTTEPLTVCEQVLECLKDYWDPDARRCTTGYSECYPTEEACRCPHRYECDAAVCE